MWVDNVTERGYCTYPVDLQKEGPYKRYVLKYLH
jgi:hypothetical protein